MTAGHQASWASDLRILRQLVFSPVRGASHAERLESFYRNQSADYDRFRARLLHGRDELFQSIAISDGTVWVDLGAGTGENAERWGPRLQQIAHAYLVDLCPALLRQAELRVQQQRWTQVQPVLSDAISYSPERPVDLVTFSYSLTMMPDWFAAVDNAFRMLRPGGQIGVVDFYVSRKYPQQDRIKHSWPTRVFWPLWFANDNVFLSSEHLPYLQRRFETIEVREASGPLPYMPFVRAPYYWFVGRK